MKVLFMFPPVHPKCDSIGMRSMPPSSLYYLATILKYKGFEVKTIDPHYLKTKGFCTSDNMSIQIINEFIEENFDVVAISANSGNWGMAKIIINLFKSIEPKIPIIVGGLHASYFDEYILKTTCADYIVRGEGEDILPKLLDILASSGDLSNLNGITYKGKNGEIIKNQNNELIDGNKLSFYPLPDYSSLPKGVYNFLPIETSRGCKFNCTFCSVTHKKSWRCLKKDVVLERINSVKNIVYEKIEGGNNIYFVDDCFSADTERALDILSTIENLNLELKIGIECRVTDLLLPNFIQKIPKQILSFIQIGVEAGYNEGLKKIRKGITIEQVEECAKIISKYNLENIAFFSFIIGFPWEEEEEIKKTIHFIAHLCNTYGVRANVSWLWLCPSDLWFERYKYDIMVKEDVFDDPEWIVNKEIFKLTHPKIDMKAFEEVEDLIYFYQSSGLTIDHPKCWT